MVISVTVGTPRLDLICLSDDKKHLCLWYAGMGGAGAWAAQASRTTQRMASLGGFAVQPLHGFAAQAVMVNSSSSGASCASTEAAGGSSVQVRCGAVRCGAVVLLSGPCDLCPVPCGAAAFCSRAQP